MRVLLIATLGLGFFAVACSHAQPNEMKPGPVQEWARREPKPLEGDEIAGRENSLLINALAFKLFAAIDKPGKNLFFSPLGVTMTLSMMANGANGETRDAILTALGDKGGVQPLNQGIWDLMVKMHDEPDCPITISNSVWSFGGIEPAQTFTKQLHDSYDAKIATVTPRGKQGADMINKWTYDSTSGLIDHVFDTIDDNTNLIFANSAAFVGTWKAEFDPKKSMQGTFTDAENSTKNATFMCQERQEFLCGETNGAQWLILPYNAKDYSMVMILPDKQTPEEYLKGLTWETWGSALGNLESTTTAVQIPRLMYRAQYDLKEMFPKLGLGDLLAHMDMSGVSSQLQGQFISTAIQTTFIDINEHGTRAAAATDISTAGGTGESFIANRPFAFAILYRPTNLIVFLGVCNDPTQV